MTLTGGWPTTASRPKYVISLRLAHVAFVPEHALKREIVVRGLVELPATMVEKPFDGAGVILLFSENWAGVYGTMGTNARSASLVGVAKGSTNLEDIILFDTAVGVAHDATC